MIIIKIKNFGVGELINLSKISNKVRYYKTYN